MKPGPTAINRALMIAKQIGARIDPGFGSVEFPKVGTGVPLMRADGGKADDQIDYSQPDSYTNMYSKAAQIASQLPMKRATPTEWKGALLNRGVKPAEIKWSEFEQRHPGNEPISREDVAKHFDIWRPDLHETDLRGPETKYEQWTMPGGKNYREVLLHEPDPSEIRHQHPHWEHVPTFDEYNDDESEDEQSIPNVYVHARLKDRMTPKQEKILHIEELQSDWGQEGRKGFRDPDPDKVPQDIEASDRFKDYIRDLSHRTGHPLDPENPYPHIYEAAQKAGEMENVFEHGRAVMEERKANARRMRQPVEGPYVGKTGEWLDLGLKHLLSHAAANGHEHIAWTPGKMQAERYPEDDEGKMAAREAGMSRFYDNMLPKQLLNLARMHDPEAQLGQVAAGNHPLPSMEITPKMRESILKHGFPAYAEGGAVGDDDDSHPLTNPVYHGINETSVSSPMAQGLNMEMFDAKHPSLNYNAPNHIALGLGPHVSRDPNIAGDYRFTTGEKYKQGVRKGAKEKGRVMMLNTLPDEKFFPVPQKFDAYGKPARFSRDADDNAVYNTVYSDVFRHNPKLAHEILTEHGHDPESADHYVKAFQRDKPFTDPWVGGAGYPYQSVEDFVATHGKFRPGKRVIDKVFKDFRKRMRDRGYAGLSYINTDEDETSQNAKPWEQVKDKKCYIVFPQRDKETGWYPMRLKHAAYDPQQRGSPVLSRADGGETDEGHNDPEVHEHFRDGGSPDLDKVRESLQRVASPFSDDPEKVREALRYAESLKTPMSGQTGTGSFYNIKQPYDVSEVNPTIVPIPGVSPLEKKKRSWEDLAKEGEGGTLINLGGDRANLGRLTHINGRELAWPVDLHAGPKYMLEPNRGQVWANAAGHTTSIKNIIQEASKRGPVYGVYSPMGPRAADSTHNMIDALLAQIPSSEISTEDAKKFDDDLRSGKHADPKIKAKAIQLMAGWPGILNAKAASEFARKLPGTHRSSIVKHMDKSTWRNAGFPAVGMTRAAISDPEVKGVSANMFGHRVVKLSAESSGHEPSFEHSTYTGPTHGEYFGDVPLVQRHYVMPDAVDRMLAKPAAGGQVVHPYSLDNMGRATARKLFEEQKQQQPINQRMIESIQQGMERQKEYGLKRGGAAVQRAIAIATKSKKKRS